MPLTTFPGILFSELPDLKMPGITAFMADVASSSNGAPITAGLFRIGAGESMPYTYEFDEFKVVLEGVVVITEDNGTTHELKAGDMIKFTKGANVSFSSPSTGLTFYVAQR